MPCPYFLECADLSALLKLRQVAACRVVDANIVAQAPFPNSETFEFEPNGGGMPPSLPVRLLSYLCNWDFCSLPINEK